MKNAVATPVAKWGTWRETFYYVLGAAAGWLVHLSSGI